MINDINSKFKNYTPYINGSENYKRASVTIPLVKHNDSLYILFEIRANTLKTQPNEVCFPGGKIENDESPLKTAIRETFEEIGIPENNIKVISPLDLFISPFNIIVHPYLVFIEDISMLNINKDEVEKIFLVPLDYLLNHTPKLFVNNINVIPHNEFPYDIIPQKENYKFNTGKYETLFYIYKDYVIWGLTAKILYNFINTYKNI